jgi:amidase
MTDLSLLDATAQARLVQNGEASAAELVDAAIERIEKVNGEVNAVIHPLFDRARAAVRAGLPAGPFTGVPIVVKDLDGTLAGAPYYAGNRALKAAKYVPDTTCSLFARLEQAGFVIVAKGNTPEFGLMPTTEPEAYGPTHNPWDLTRSSGGSSGGPAAAVATGMVPLAHAGDGGGSIRIPASMCGLFGLKPTRGRISLGPAQHESWAGLVMRHVVTHSVRDSAAVLDVLQGYTTGDWYTAPPPKRPYADEVGAPKDGLRIGIRTSAPLGVTAVDAECSKAAAETATLLESLGHTVVEAGPAALDDGALLETFTLVMLAAIRADIAEVGTLIGRPLTASDVEASTWANYEAAAAIDAGTYIAALTKMQAWARRAIGWWLDDGFDVLLTPTLAEPPPRLGELTDPETGTGRMLPFVIFTAPFNVTGQPAMSVPLAMSASGLPVGVHFVAAPYREDVLFRLATQLEEARPWRDRRPGVHA